MTLDQQSLHRIVVFQTAFLGDVILTLPLVQALKERFPDSLIDMVTLPAASSLARTAPGVRDVITYDKKGVDRGLKGMLKISQRLRQKEYDLAIVPHRSFRSALIIRAAGIPERIGFETSAGRFLFTHTVPHIAEYHEVNRNLVLASPFEIDPERFLPPVLNLLSDDQDIAEKWLKQENIFQAPIALAPGSVWATKRWPATYYGELAKMLILRGEKVILVGGPDDLETAKEVEKTSGAKLANAVGKFSLRESAALIKYSKLLVSNDSAPLHMAVGVQTPIVSIFGPTIPAFGFAPYFPEDKILEIDGLSCRPCGKHGGDKCPIGTFDCMLEISPGLVLKKIEERLDELKN